MEVFIVHIQPSCLSKFSLTNDTLQLVQSILEIKVLRVASMPLQR